VHDPDPAGAEPAASVRFYTDVLGFVLDWGGEADAVYASVSRDGRPIMLSTQADLGRPGWVWIGLESDALWAEFRLRQVRVLQEPRNWSWAYEMKFADPDGNVLWMGTESRADLPCEDRPSPDP
jgi:catechol 2,3-dioxygenase-like lactoylglutathione lyase family enzyme